jgi:uncharacterized RmlC-like cupin family protein
MGGARCRIIPADGSSDEGKQGLVYFSGVSAENTGARQLCLHLLVNVSSTHSARGVVARTDPNEQESVVLLPHLDAVVK